MVDDCDERFQIGLFSRSAKNVILQLRYCSTESVASVVLLLAVGIIVGACSVVVVVVRRSVGSVVALSGVASRSAVGRCRGARSGRCLSAHDG